MAHMVFCTRYKQEMEGLDEPPFDSDFGNKVYHNVSKKAWGEWLEHQKMLLNEYRLQPWTPQAQEFPLLKSIDPGRRSRPNGNWVTRRASPSRSGGRSRHWRD